MLSNHADYSKFTDTELETSLTQVEVELKSLSNTKKQIVETILNRNETLIADLLSQKPEPYGSITINNFEITYGKKISYDQKMLATLAKEIEAAGEPVSDYINVEYDVSEAKFKAFPESIRKQFIPARTIKQANPSIKIKER